MTFFERQRDFSGKFIKKEFCVRGHRLSETRIKMSGKYFCKICKKLSSSKNVISLNEKEYNNLTMRQVDGCEICGNQNEKDRLLAIDHNHENNKVRGLLCGKCNRMLGLAKDNSNILIKAIEYLNKYK